MKVLLERLGFVPEEVIGTFPLEAFLLSGKNYVGNHIIGRACQKERKSFELLQYKNNSDILNDLYRGLAVAGIGREFIIIAKKK